MLEQVLGRQRTAYGLALAEARGARGSETARPCGRRHILPLLPRQLIERLFQRVASQHD